jgi:CubicO group peptidase (beta-lactamase class C family)
MPRWLTCCLLLALGALSGAAPARPAYDLDPVDAEAQRLVAKYGLPGASLRLSRSPGVVHRQTYGGYAGNERLAIASASKWLSALTLARLVERGDLRWNSTVGEYFPDAPPAMRPITLVQLFSHTSGMAIEDPPCLSDRFATLQSCARDILAIPLAAAPGTVFAYGGNSMHVAGAMAEIATGQAWDDLFIAQMVQPLGLSDTDWTAGATRAGYVRNANPRIAGGARSTLDDYGRVMDMLLAGGLHAGQSFLRADTLATMAVDRTAGLVVAYTPVPGYDFGYGIGQWVEARDAFGATYRVSSPGAFGFTPWVDWQNGSSGVLVVLGNGGLMRDDLTALERLCLRQLDFVRYTQSAGKPAAPSAAPPRASPPLPSRPTRPAPPALDGKRRAL